MIITKSEYAKHCGVACSTVTKWVKSGRIPVLKNGKIDVDAADRMREITESPLPHHQARKAQFEEQREQQQQQQSFSSAVPMLTGSDLDTAEKIALRTKLAMMKEREAKAELTNLELDKQAGALIEKNEVDFVLAEYGATLRTVLERMPDRLTGELVAANSDAPTVHKIVTESVHETLAEIAAQLERMGSM